MEGRSSGAVTAIHRRLAAPPFDDVVAGDDSMRIGNSTFEVRAVSFKSVLVAERAWPTSSGSRFIGQRRTDLRAVLLVLMYGASYVVAFAPFRRRPGTTSPT